MKLFLQNLFLSKNCDGGLSLQNTSHFFSQVELGHNSKSHCLCSWKRKNITSLEFLTKFFLNHENSHGELLILPLCARYSTFAGNVVAKQKLVQFINLPQWGVVLLGLANTITNKDNHSKRSRNSKPTSNKRGLCHLYILKTSFVTKYFLIQYIIFF